MAANEKDWESLNQRIMACRSCPRLVSWREEVALKKRRAFKECEYWGKPVPGFGDPQARLLVVGLAPGAHGSNRTGRMFTGDSSGIFLYSALHRAGFASQPTSHHRMDGLVLTDIFITALCRCVPPANKPLPSEIQTCRPFLLEEYRLLPNVEGLVALGRVAFEQLLQIYAPESKPAFEFGHGTFFRLGEGKPWLLASYHPSQQNTQTGRLTVAMFDRIWQQARDLLK